MLQKIQVFFDSSQFLPHGHCFFWLPSILWLHVISDATIAISYFLIPFTLIYFIRKRKDVPFRMVFILFGAFILFCGTTHFMSIWVLWYPNYAVEGIIKALTAIVSFSTFCVLIKMIPQALLLPSPSQLYHLNEELRVANQQLETLYQQMQESGQAHLHAVVNNILDGLITINDQACIKSFNPACERIFGYAPEEIMGKNIKTLMPEPYYSQKSEVIAHDLQTIGAKIIGLVSHETQARRKDGSLVTIELSISAFTLADGQHFSGIIRDITERKKNEQDLKDSANRLKAVFNTVVDGLITIDSQANIQSFNAAAEGIFGYVAAEVRGKNVKILMPEPYHNNHDNYVSNYLTTGQAKVIGIGREVVAKRKDGSVFPMELGVSEFSIGDERAFVGIIRNISDRKEAEAQLLRYTKALERSNQDLEDFAYIVSHDLKEPLRGIFNNTKFLQADYQDKLDEAGTALLLRLEYLSNRMEQLVNDLLHFSRLSKQELAIQSTDLNMIIKDVESLIEALIQDKNVMISIPRILPTITCDKLRITEVFRNLIINAIKYNNKANIHIEIGYVEEMHVANRRERNVFYVKDNGIGIEEKYYDEIFRIFKRLTEEDDEIKGTGIGLTFVRKIIERHGGRIWLSSEVNRGTTFYFTICQGETYEAAA